MASINRHGVDQTTIQFQQAGSNETEVTLRDVLLDEKLNYHFCVSSLLVPLDRTPIFEQSDDFIMRIVRRNVGEEITNANVTLHSFDGQFQAVANDVYLDAQSFFHGIWRFCDQFNQLQGAVGIPALGAYGGINNQDTSGTRFTVAVDAVTNWLSVDLTPDGRVRWKLSSLFTNHFMIELSRYGVELMGLQKVVQKHGNLYYLAVTTAGGNMSPNLPILDGGDELVHGNNIRPCQVISKSNIYQLFDHRVSIRVESHLPIANNKAVDDGLEQLDSSICTTFVAAPVTIMQEYKEQWNPVHSISRRVFTGLCQLVRKSQSNFQWHRLLTSYQLKYLRLSLWVRYRRFNTDSESWYFEKKPLVVPDGAHWETTLRFVSDA